MAPGELVLLEGASGSGKSTVLRLATGLIPRVQGGRLDGAVSVDGRPVATLGPGAFPRTFGWVPQDPEGAFVARTVERDLMGVLENVGVTGREARLTADEALAEFGAAHLAQREVATLSGGEATRVALACAVAPRPGYLVLDEPDAQLDADASRELAGTLRALKAGGTGVLVGAHAPHPFDALATETRTLGARSDVLVRAALPEPRSGPPTLRAFGLTHRFPGGAGIGPIDLELGPGEVVAVTGPNGSGKTTLIHALAGLIEPQQGTVRVEGEAPRRLSARALADRLGVSFQHPAWHITQDTVADEIALTARRLGRATRVAEVLTSLGLAGLARAHPWDLSGGERQRLAVATAAAHRPRVLLLDEPTRGLDADALARFAALLRDRCENGLSTLIATHHPAMAQLAHRTLRLERGEIVDERRSVRPAAPHAEVVR